MEILLIDDDLNILKKIQKSLKDSDLNIKCTITTSCEQGLELFKIHQFELVVLDMKFSISKMDGLTFIKNIRNSKSNIPIIVISGTTEIQEKVKALDLGADDYILKPFDSQELIARIKRQISRNNNHFSNVFKIGPLILDLEVKEVVISEGKIKYEIKLTNKEYQLLEFLVLKKGVFLSKNLLLKKLYSYNEPDAKIIDVLICKIRKKLLNYTSEKLIITSWGRGYAIKWNHDNYHEFKKSNQSDSDKYLKSFKKIS